MVEEQNMLLRSAYQIALRKGEDTNWDAFLKNVKQELLTQAGISDRTTDEQLVLKATCTPRTFKIYKEETCPKCGGTGEIKYYHDAGDHFSMNAVPGSEWRTKPCPKCACEEE